jgi:probable F420-dependent oxidoreductase
MIPSSESRFSIMLGNLGGINDTLAAAHLAERSGFRKAWFPEAAGPNALIASAIAARETSLEVGTAIVSAYTRTPALLAMAAADLAQLSEGRTVHLGIGPGSPLIVKKWNGVEFERPLAHVKETIAILRQALSGKPTGYEGEVCSSHEYRLPVPPSSPVRLHVGAVGPAMLRLATRHADGLILAYSTPEMVRTRVAEFEFELQRTGRRREEVSIAASAFVAVTAQPQAVREAFRNRLVLFANEASSPGYARNFRLGGFGEGVDRVTAAMAEGDIRAAQEAIPDRLLEGLLAAGTKDEVAERVSEYASTGVDEVLMSPVPNQLGADPGVTIKTLGASLLNSASS